MPTFDVLLPVGISFYTFQALSYTMDVYRGEIYAERNLFKYALFVSFFPQLVAGPIERSENLLVQVNQPHEFDADRARDGLLLMLWGFFQKVVIADRIATLINHVYRQLDRSGRYLDRAGNRAVRRADLLRLWRLFEHCHRRGPGDGLYADGKLQATLSGHVVRRFLAPLAHFAVLLVP